MAVLCVTSLKFLIKRETEREREREELWIQEHGISSKESYRHSGTGPGEAMWTSFRNAVRAGLPKPMGACILPPHVLEVGHGTTGFIVCLMGFWSCCSLVFPWNSLVLTLCNGNDTLCHCVVEVCK
jgi:hypothetical protein